MTVTRLRGQNPAYRPSDTSAPCLLSIGKPMGRQARAGRPLHHFVVPLAMKWAGARGLNASGTIDVMSRLGALRV